MKRRQRKNKNCIRFVFMICFILVINLLSGQFMPMKVEASSLVKRSSKVRVGYVERERFAEGSSDEERKSGYSYEYLMMLSNMTGWEYEYVYGDWDETLERLERGEIDIMPGVSYTKKRSKKMLFPKQRMGFESYYIFKSTDDIYAEDSMEELKGNRVGCTKNSLRTVYLQQWNEEHDGICEVVIYDGNEQLYEAFRNQKIDAIASTDNVVLPFANLAPVEKIGESDYYVAVTRSRPDLLSMLNQGQNMLETTFPYYTEYTHGKYYYQNMISNRLSEGEKKLIEEKDILKIGYLRNNMPFCDEGSLGNPEGVFVDIIDQMLENMELKDSFLLEYAVYDNAQDLTQALIQGEIDISFPVYGDVWSAESGNIRITNPVSEGTQVLIFAGSYDATLTDVIVVEETNLLQREYISQFYPDSQIVFCDSKEDCLNLVLTGKATGTIMSGIQASELLAKDVYNLNIVELPQPYNISFGVNENSTDLLLLLNRCLYTVDEQSIKNLLYKYQTKQFAYTMEDFLEDNMKWLFLVVVLVLSLICIMVIRFYQKEHKLMRYQIEQDKKLEEALILAEEANRAKGTFLFHMSHDIRTPMNAIIGFTELLEKSLDDKEVCENYLSKIKDSNEYLLSLINNVLEMARIDSGKVTVEEKYMNLQVIIDSIFSMFELQMKEKSIDFKYIIEVEHKNVLGDDTKFREIYMNLLSNALKYTQPGGSVCLCVSEEESKETGVINVKTVVSDTGIGMTDEYLKEIFVEFSRERSSTESKITGTGLGMSIVKKMVDILGGTITVESKELVGTSFTVILPFKIASSAETMRNQEKINTKTLDTKEGEAPSDLRGIRLMLVEDNALNAEIATAFLEKSGLVVEHASNGAECVELLEKAQEDFFDVILMDIQMPIMDGYEASRQIRNMMNTKKANIPIIAMTANAFEEDKESAFAAGMNAHIAKPIKRKLVLQTIHDCIKN